MKKIGVIGGMGPEATLDFYKKIIKSTSASCDQDHIPVVLDICPQIPDRTNYILRQGRSPLPRLLSSSESLMNIGVSALCMPCNTAHYFVDAIRENISVPFISMIDCVLLEVQRKFPKARRIGLMATSGTLASGVYLHSFNKVGLEISPLSDSAQSTIMDIIYAVKAGRQNEVKPVFQQCVYDMEKRGAEVIIAGCTELPLLMKDMSTSVPVIDPTLLLARTVVDFASA